MAAESSVLSVKVDDRPDQLVITVGGTINEDSNFDVPEPAGRPVVVDARNVERINSMGVRAWIQFMAKLNGGSGQVVMRHLPPVLVSQASMITSFLGSAQVESFLSPWFCPNCEHTLEQEHAGNDALPEAIQCPKCQSAMELDWDPDAYLAFRG